MSRLSLACFAAFAIGLCSLAAPACSAPASATAPRPNIIFFELDDLAAPYAGPWGSTTAQTPEMDRLAAHGVVFANAVCQGMMCGPSRNSLIVGKYPHQLGFYRNGDMRSLPERPWAFPAALQRAGYRTIWIGKSHIKPHGSKENPRAMEQQLGFDEAIHTLGRAMLSGAAGERPNPYRTHLVARGLLAEHEANTAAKRNTTLPEDDYLDGWFTRLAEDRIRDHDGARPLFLWLNYSLPHGPFDVPDADHAPFADVPMPGVTRPVNFTHPPSLISSAKPIKSEEQALKAQRGFHAAIRFADRQLGRIRTAIEKKGIADNTIIVFFSDHGIFWGEHGLMHKGTLFRQITNPSLIVAGAGVRRGARTNQAVELTDLLPTFLELAGADPADHPQNGTTLRPLLEGTGSAAREYAFAEIRDWIVVAGARWRLILRAPIADAPAQAPPPPADAATPTGEAEDPKAARKRRAQEARRAARKAAAGKGKGSGKKKKKLKKKTRPDPADDPPGPDAFLFDDIADPGNLRDVAAEHPDIVRKMRAAAADWIRRTGPRLPPGSM